MYSQQEAAAAVKNIISRISRIDASELDDQLRFREEVGVDSIMALEIIASCEKELGIAIDESGLSAVETLGGFVNHVAAIYRSEHGQN